MRKELFTLLSLKGIYLTSYELSKAVGMLSSKSFDDASESLNRVEEYYMAIKDKFQDPSQGAYVVENLHLMEVGKAAKKVLAIDIETGEEKEFDSIYKASVAIAGGKNGVGNISRVLNGKRKSCYKHNFKFV